jgi:hypothetical protein
LDGDFGGDGLGGVLLFRKLESRVTVGLLVGVVLPLRVGSRLRGGLSDRALLAGLRKILYIWCVGLGGESV